MKLPRGSVDVGSGVAVRDGEFLPSVRLEATLESGGSSVTVYLSPAEARKIGADLISASVASVSDALLRAIARTHGLDGDGLIVELDRRQEAAGL